MYKYTPNKTLLKQFKRLQAGKSKYARQTPSAYEFAWRLCGRLGGDSHTRYAQTEAFLQHWEGTQFFSEVKLKQIPINGILFPLEFFDETDEENDI